MSKMRVGTSGARSRSTLESLEGRCLLSAVSLGDDGVLRVEGTRRADAVVVSAAETSGGSPAVRVVLNGREFLFQLSEVRIVQVVTGQGDDNVYTGTRAKFLDRFKNAPAVPLDVAAGDGHDTVSGTTGDDTIRGGDGRDLLFGGSGDDDIRGDDGNDTILGNAGRDTINGGDGRDSLYGDEYSLNVMPIGGNTDPGDEVDDITGGRGRDTFFDGDDESQYQDRGRADRLGFNTVA
jgi:Ca2+-binding RTX toxin-like protein